MTLRTPAPPRPDQPCLTPPHRLRVLVTDPPRRPPPPPPRLRVLVTAPAPDTAESLAALLRMCGHAAETAGTGGQAVRLATAAPPDAVVFTLDLPGMVAGELAAALRCQC